MSFVNRKMLGFSLLELLLSVSIGAFMCIGIFNLYGSLNHLILREQVVSSFTQNMQFINHFLRRKINQAGDWSCANRFPGALSIPIKGYTSVQAKQKLGLSVKQGTDLLRLRECVRFHGKLRYLPIMFFVANTFRVTSMKKPIYALFYKVAHHPREELIAGITRMSLTFGEINHAHNDAGIFYSIDELEDWSSVRFVRLEYLLSAHQLPLQQAGVLYAAMWRQ